MSWKQNKGKDLTKIAKSKLDEIGPYYISKKFDGHYVQIVYDGEDVNFFTSGGKEFYIANMARDIINSDLLPFAIECEYLYDCDGKLGSRGKSARLTTYRTEYIHNLATKGNPTRDKFVILDILLPEKFNKRLNIIHRWFDNFDGWFEIPVNHLGDLSLAQKYTDIFVAAGYEGAMAKSLDHIYQQGKRTNDIVKLKPRLTVDLLCLDTIEGQGKYEGMIGSLVLLDNKGRRVDVGSGLTDNQRGLNPLHFMGKLIEIEYERIDDTYIQPVFKHIRNDKSRSDMD